MRRLSGVWKYILVHCAKHPIVAAGFSHHTQLWRGLGQEGMRWQMTFRVYAEPFFQGCKPPSHIPKTGPQQTAQTRSTEWSGRGARSFPCNSGESLSSALWKVISGCTLFKESHLLQPGKASSQQSLVLYAGGTILLQPGKVLLSPSSRYISKVPHSNARTYVSNR